MRADSIVQASLPQLAVRTRSWIDQQRLALLIEAEAIQLGEFVALLEREDLYLDLAPLVYWSHWITPSLEPKRFDTRFFTARAPADQQAEADRFVRWIGEAIDRLPILRIVADRIDQRGVVGKCRFLLGGIVELRHRHDPLRRALEVHQLCSAAAQRVDDLDTGRTAADYAHSSPVEQSGIVPAR